MFSHNLKIAIFSNTFGPRDAMGQHVHLIKKVFPEAEIFLERGNEDPQIAAHTYYFIKRYPWMSLYMLEWRLGLRLKALEWVFRPFEKLAFRHEARKLVNYDIVLVEWGLYHKAIHLLPFLARLEKRPRLIFDYHGVTPPEQILSRGKRLIAQKTIEVAREGADYADICLVRSQFMAEELKGFGHPQKIVLNPLPFLGAECSDAHPAQLRRKYGLEKKKILLYIGRISTHKNLEVVVRSLGSLSRDDVYFIVVGNNRHRSLAAEKERLFALARDLGIPHRIIFTGEVSQEELVSWYRACDVFVMPSFHEGFCWPLVDAMAYGKPVLASHYGAIPETLGEAGLYFDAKNPKDLAEKINQILEDQDLQNRLAQMGREKVKEYSFRRYQRELKQAVAD
ncbi:MAG: glycosyltransferase family 1 protein [Candidatus Doudnabacteria bacterium]